MAEETLLTHFFASGPWTCGGLLRVTDPCYSKQYDDTGLAGTLRAMPGPWLSAIVKGRRVLSLYSWKEGAAVPGDDSNWEGVAFSAGVDSGQCGFFDDARYPQYETGDYEDAGTLYGQACRITLGPAEFGLIDLGLGPVGIVASSGYGDGLYDVFCRKTENGLVDAVRVIFMDDEDDEDGEDDEDEYYEDAQAMSRGTLGTDESLS